MGYKNDVFISYNHRYQGWVQDIFYKLFEHHLSETVNYDVKIFVDYNKIKGGDDWNYRIKNELIYSPAYFRSEWCVKEFAILDYRQKECGFRTLENPDGIVLPINICDGEHFPKFATQIQYTDFRAYNWDSIKNTELYLPFQRTIAEYAKIVAKAIQSAPMWNQNWLSDDARWIENPPTNYPINEVSKFSQPTL
jgi:TIR domain